jgi:tellurite resistance protein TerC
LPRGGVTTFDIPAWAWIVLGAVIVSSVVVDLLAHRGNKSRGRGTAILWSSFWIGLAVAFGAWIAAAFGTEWAEDYFTAYLVEKTLSIDNLFVFIVIFSRLKIPEREQHRVLTWGIMGAFVTRGAFIAAGAGILSAWHGVVYVLGAFLVFTGLKIAREQATGSDDDGKAEGRILAFVRRHLRFTPRLHGHHFVAEENGRRLATPLLLALIVIEITDVLFAVDSIPAVFAVTREPFIVYASNVFAVLGLRALYLVLADLLKSLRYLRYGLAAILVFAGAKMLTADVFHVPPVASLLVVVAILVAVTLPSLAARRHRAHRRAHSS